MALSSTIQREHRPRSGIALGGLGAGWFEIRHDGTFQNWNIFNNRPLFTGPRCDFDPKNVLFFLVRFHVEGETPELRLLQIDASHGSAALEDHEFHYIFPWLNGVDRIEATASFPFTNLTFRERDMPLDIELEAWSPFIPHDAKNSALPLAFFRFKVVSQSPKPVRVTLLATLRNGVGYDLPTSRLFSSRIVRENGWAGFELGATGLDPAHPSAGTMGVTSRGEDSRIYAGWAHPHPYYERLLAEDELPELDDTPHRVTTDKATGKKTALPECYATVGRATVLATPGAVFEHEFLASWYFPNNYAQPVAATGERAGYLEDATFPGTAGTTASPGAPAAASAQPPARRLEGHYYANFFDSSTSVARHGWATRDHLERETRAFHTAYFDSTVEPAVLDQVNSHFNTFRTSSWFTKAGDFGINEGLNPYRSFAGLATIDVAMYGHVMTSALFPALDRAVIEAHRRLQNPNGSVVHSIRHNFAEKHPREASGKRIDMPAQYVALALRHAFWSDDREWARALWPSITAALDYILRERDPNRDLLPDMDGIMCSYDNFPMYGVAPYVATQWLAAVSLAADAAAWLGDSATEARFRDVLTRGARTVEDLTWNGSYYRLYNTGGDAPKIDEGCLADQVIGVWAAHLTGAPPFLDRTRVRTALRAIVDLNYHDKQGLRNCQWPGDTFLHPVDADCWVDQANTCWTGVELGFAALLIYEDLVDDGLKIIRNVDDRYRRSGMYWDHQEFGGHYFRPMSAWSILHALLGLAIDRGHYRFRPHVTGERFKLLFTTADGYAHFEAGPREARIAVARGTFTASRLTIELDAIPAGAAVRVDGAPGKAPVVETAAGRVLLDGPLRIPAGVTLVVSW